MSQLKTSLQRQVLKNVNIRAINDTEGLTIIKKHFSIFDDPYWDDSMEPVIKNAGLHLLMSV